MIEIKNCGYYGYKVGDRFRIVNKEGVGSDIEDCYVLTLSRDDGSEAPKFNGDNGDWGYADLCALEKINDTQVWSDEGLPPVGTVCEGLLQVEAGYPKWVKVEILKIVNGRCAVYRDDCDMLKWCDEFRPLRTKRDKWIETASKLFHDADCGVPTDAAFGAIYDKLIAKDAE